MKTNVPSGHTITAARASGMIASTPRPSRWMTTHAKVSRMTAVMGYGNFKITRFTSRDPDDGRHFVDAVQDGRARQVRAEHQVEPARRRRQPVACRLGRSARLEQD